MATKFNGLPMGGELRLRPQESEFWTRLMLSLEGQPVEVSVKKVTKPKSWEQVKNHFGNALLKIVQKFDHDGWDVSMIYREIDNPTGVPVTFAILQQFFYAKYPTYNDDHKIITMSSPDFTSAHASTLFKAIQAHAASQWRIVIEDPNKDWKQQAEQGK